MRKLFVAFIIIHNFLIRSWNGDPMEELGGGPKERDDELNLKIRVKNIIREDHRLTVRGIGDTLVRRKFSVKRIL